MSEELAKQFGLIIGQKVLYPISNRYSSPTMYIVTIKDVIKNYDNEIVLITEELEGYLNITSVYSQRHINKLFELPE